MLAVAQFTPSFGDKDGNLKKIGKLLEPVDAQVIVLPELCTTGYFFLSKEEAANAAETADGLTISFFRDMAVKKNAVFVVGFAEKDGDRVFNSCATILPERDKPYIYRKTHLFYKETLCFDYGNTGFFVIDDPARNIRIGPMICYDWRFPEAARTLAISGADLIVCPSNLVTDAWRQVIPARAIENKTYIAVSNRGGRETRNGEELIFKGNSAIYGYNGKIVCRADPYSDDVLIARIYPVKTRDKSFNAINNVFKDRQPRYYAPLTQNDEN